MKWKGNEMESEKFVMWSGRLSGWLSPGGTFVNLVKDARQFSHSEMIEYGKMNYKNGYAEYGLLPVSLDHLKEIAG